MLRERRPPLLTHAGLLLACLLVVLGEPLLPGNGTTAIGGLDRPAADASGTPVMPSETAGLPSPSVAEPLPTPAESESEPAGAPARRFLACHGNAVHAQACPAPRAALARRHPHRGRGPPAA